MKILRAACSALLSLFLAFNFLNAQSLTLVDTVQFPFTTNSLGDVGGSDCWGWTGPDGTEYAFVGTLKGLGIVNATTGQKIQEIEGPDQFDGYYHRDMVTYGHYLYCVAEMFGNREGMMIVDLSPLPDSVRYVSSFVTSQDITSHNMDIDSATGFAYVVKDAYDGVRIIDLANPEVPVETSLIPGSAIHDVFARNDTAWMAEGTNKAYSVWDCSDKLNPTLIARVTDPNFGYCHNIWPSDNGKYFVTTEETSFKTVKIWDMSNPSNVVLRGEYIAPNQLAHNVHVMGDFIFISHYTSGVTVVDFSDPDNPFEAAAYDCYPANDISDFYGTWGCFPFTNSGKVYASNFEGLLFILQWDPLAVGLEEGMIENTFELGQNYPNPVSESTTLPFTLHESGEVLLEIFDFAGNLVDVPLAGILPAGNHEINWSRDGFASGTYFYRLTGPGKDKKNKATVKKMVIAD